MCEVLGSISSKKKISYREPEKLLQTNYMKAKTRDCWSASRMALLLLLQAFGVTHHLRVSHETLPSQQLFQWMWNRTDDLHYRGLSWDWSEVCSCPFGEEKRKVQSHLKKKKRNPRIWSCLCHPSLHFTEHLQTFGTWWQLVLAGRYNPAVTHPFP